MSKSKFQNNGFKGYAGFAKREEAKLTPCPNCGHRAYSLDAHKPNCNALRSDTVRGKLARLMFS